MLWLGVLDECVFQISGNIQNEEIDRFNTLCRTVDVFPLNHQMFRSGKLQKVLSETANAFVREFCAIERCWANTCAELRIWIDVGYSIRPLKLLFYCQVFQRSWSKLLRHFMIKIGVRPNTEHSKHKTSLLRKYHTALPVISIKISKKWRLLYSRPTEIREKCESFSKFF